LITAGTLHALSSLEALKFIAKANTEFVKGLKTIGAAGFLAKQGIFQVAMYGLNQVAQKQADRYADSNSGKLEATAKSTSESIAQNNYEPYLRRIFANDAAYGMATQVTELENYAQEVAKDHKVKFKDTASTITRGVASGTIGGLAGGFGIFGQTIAIVANSAIDASIGVIKLSEAPREFEREMSNKIRSKYKTLDGSRALMVSSLQREGITSAADIIEQLQYLGFVTGEEIAYDNCASIKLFDLGAFNNTRDRVIANCNNVAKYMGLNDTHTIAKLRFRKNYLRH
jgi:hypothetical protein